MASTAPRRFQSILIFLFAAFVLVPRFAAASDLTVFIEKREAVFHIRAVSAFDTISFAIEPRAGFTEKMVRIYEMIGVRQEEGGTLEKVGDFMGQQVRTVRSLLPFWKDEGKNKETDAQSSEADTLNRLLDEAGALLFSPMEAQLAIAKSVDFVIDAESLFYSFDALHFGNEPLFLKKDVSYRFSEEKTATPKASASWRGLIIADEDTDPEKGAEAVSVLFPGAFGFDADTVQPKDIESISSADFILISAEGGVDGLQVKHMVLRPQTLSRLKPELVYLDCNLYGLNLNFINHFKQVGVSAYVAPVFGRWTGKDSAQTMIRFFRAMLNGENPSRSLYLARKTLYDASILNGEDVLTAMRIAFPFRLYQFGKQ
ncbi:hypothetical protein [uncultured Desulfosarcina sp.]|uniref:hypothetical protein n=1 Tax=uncultured Desulfosarcina sp. TaxID=218289 RepID=UPI0029C8C791|nr:hypothetical protein [uncultured Desulfosarcina sp.]